MKAQPFAVTRGTRFCERWNTGQYPSSSSWIESAPITASGCTHGSIVKGDKKSPNPWSYTVQEVSFLQGLYSLTTNYRNGDVMVSRGSGGIAFNDNHQLFDVTLDTSDLRNRALSDLNEKTRGSLDLSVDLFQSGQTARMLRLFNTAHSYVRTFRGWRGLIRGASNARLEWVYGWKPIIADIYEAACESKHVVTNALESFTGKAHEKVPSGPISPEVPFYGGLSMACEREGIHAYKIVVSLATRDADPARWASLNPVSIAWELVPYSFVVDWFYNVGDYLRNYETSLLYANRFVSGYESHLLAYTADAHGSGSRQTYDDYGSVSTYVAQASSSGSFKSFERSLLFSYPVPNLPSFKADLGSGRLLNLAALLGNKLRR